jgi:uncharacterized DUF497 family protein
VILEWDTGEAEINRRRHGVSFPEAGTVFAAFKKYLLKIKELRTWVIPEGKTKAIEKRRKRPSSTQRKSESRNRTRRTRARRVTSSSSHPGSLP